MPKESMDFGMSERVYELIDKLAQAMYWKEQHIDPGPDEWSELSDWDRDYYRRVVAHVMRQTEAEQLLNSGEF